MNGSGQDPWMLVGRIVGAFGLHGEAKVEPYSDFPERFSRMTVTHVGSDRAELRVVSSRQHKTHVLLKFEGVETPEMVHPLCGEELFVPRSSAMPLPLGHYFLDEVIGMSVHDPVGNLVGSVTEVIRTGANDVFVVGAGRDAVLIPMVKEAVRQLDVPGRQMVVESWALDAPI